jgi:hypothetical protein
MPEMGEWGIEEPPEEEEVVVEERVICPNCAEKERKTCCSVNGRKEGKLHRMVPLRNARPRE